MWNLQLCSAQTLRLQTFLFSLLDFSKLPSCCWAPPVVTLWHDERLMLWSWDCLCDSCWDEWERVGSERMRERDKQSDRLLLCGVNTKYFVPFPFLKVHLNSGCVCRLASVGHAHTASAEPQPPPSSFITSSWSSCVTAVWAWPTRSYVSIFIDVRSYEFQSCHCIIFFTRQMIIKGNPRLDQFSCFVGVVLSLCVYFIELCTW